MSKNELNTNTKQTNPNIKELQKETLKICTMSQELLEELSKREKEKKDNNNSDKTLSLENLNTHQDTLKNEIQKLKNLEYVIAVVGTMKSGKSMTINAIVGQEILPSREFPMTTLPTLITHVPNKPEPTLHIKKIEPFNTLKEEIKVKLKTDTSDLSSLGEIKELGEKIKNNEIEFQQKYEGQENISKFLKEINDLMRIAKELELNPPYAEYTDVDDLPRIEVEFYHLKKHNQNASEAKLTLLDTPGPDEVKQSKLLKQIFDEQLQRASAVTLVVDYTKMNNESDADVKEQVKHVANMLGKKHLFVLLNKFDQRNQDKDETESYEEAKRLIYDDILKDKIDKNSVYPISSKSAFYANRGLCELDRSGKIDGNLPWRKSFGVEVLGRRWEKYINDNEEVIEACNDVWKDSFFEEPLNNIISTIHNEASLMALDSPLTKVGSILDILDKGLSVEKNAYEEDIETLQDNINDVRNEIVNIGQISKQIKKTSDDLIITLKNELEEKSKKNIKSLQEDYSSKINEKIKSIYSKREENAKYKPRIGKGKEVFGGEIEKKISEQLKELEKKGILELERKEEAEEIKNIFNKLLQEEVENFYLSSEEKLNNKIVNLSNKLNKIIQEKLGNTLHIIEKKFGSDFTIDLPQIGLENHNMNKNTQLDGLYSKDKKTTYKKSEKLYKKFFGWFNTDWGFDEVKVNVYIIKKTEVQEKSKVILEEILNELNNLIDNTITNKIDKKLNKILDILLTDIEGYRGMQEDVLIARQKSQINIDRELSIVKNFLTLNTKLSNRRNTTHNILPTRSIECLKN